MAPHTQPAAFAAARTLGFVVSVGLAVVTVAGAQASRDAALDRSHREAATTFLRSTTELSQATHTAMAAVDTVAGRSTTTGGPGSVAGLAIEARADGVTSVTWIPHPSAGGTAAGFDPTLTAALDLARDQGRLHLSAPYVDGGVRVVAAIRAVYNQDGALTIDGGLGTNGQRRARLAGWVVGVIPTRALMRAADAERLLVVARDGPTLVGRTGTGSHETIANATLQFGGRVWTVTASADAHAPLGSRFWAITIAGLLSIVVVSGGVRWGDLRSRRRDADLEGLRSQLAMISDVAPVVQHTLDLGAVLPAAAVRLSDRLALSGVSFILVDDHGRHTEVFAYGASPDPTAASFTSVADGVPANTSIALSLQRGGRVGGVMRVRTTRALSATECGGLAAVAEMVNSALMTARIFDQQAQAVKRLSELDALKSTFLETASHELRTPVTAIAGFARLAHEQWEELPEDQRKLFIDRIWANAGVLDNLVADLLNFSRMERGSLRAHNEPVALSELVPEVVERLMPVFDEHRIASAIAPGVVVAGDRRGIEQIVTNLLSNAAKFSPADSEIFVRLQLVEGRAVLTIDDEGPGVPEAERERIFSRFFRGRGAAVIQTRGAGIGLSVVKALADQMDATVDVGDNPAGGARFTVTFPPPVSSAAAREENHVARS